VVMVGGMPDEPPQAANPAARVQQIRNKTMR
jgi:hypothetical protein